MIRRRLLAAAATTLIAATAACGPGTDGERVEPEAPDLAGVVITPARQVGDLTLPEVTEGREGTEFAFQARPGAFLAVYFGYTYCPDVCPTTMSDLKAALARVDGASDRVDVAVVTVDPERDTPEVLNDYVTHYFPADHAHALRTEDPARLRTVEEGFDATSEVTVAEDGTVEVSHTGNLMLVDDAGTVRVMWPFGIPIDDLESDLRILLAEDAGDAA